MYYNVAMSSGLTQTLSFGLDIATGSTDDLHDGCIEARRIRNEVNRLDRQRWDWDNIKSTVVDNANHVQNTTQLIVDKALGEIKQYHDNKADGWGRPHPYIEGRYPMVMNHTEGYRLFHEDDAIQFRISTAPRNHVKGELWGSPDQLDRLRTALNNAEWRVGTAEVVYKHDEWRLHITVTKEDCDVASPDDADTIVGVDVNEDCVALAALGRNGAVKDSLVVAYPSIKEQRHEFFTKRKRMQTAGQTGFESVIQTEECDYVHDCLHKVSRQVVDWISQFTAPVLVFEDLKDMRDSIDYGTRMNRRLHSLPFASLQDMLSYKAAWAGIPTVKTDPEYTSQRCPRTDCQHTARGNRHKKRFKCQQCGFQDHADRKAAVCIVQNWLDERTENVPSLETLPSVRKVRRAASGHGGVTDSHGAISASGVDRHGTSAQPLQGAREELKTVASGVQD